MTDITIQTESDLTKAKAFSEKQTKEKPHDTYLHMMMKSNSIQVRAAYKGKKIVGLRCFSRVINPFNGTMGLALVHDLSNGYEIEPEV